jgi:RNA polymerase sigma factor (sigma-70 family)
MLFADKLGQFIRSRVSDAVTVEDILHDVFVKIQKGLGQLQDPARLEGWIYLIARNAIIDHYRMRKETVEVPDTLPAEPDSRDGELRRVRAVKPVIPYSCNSSILVLPRSGNTPIAKPLFLAYAVYSHVRVAGGTPFQTDVYQYSQQRGKTLPCPTVCGR